MSVSPPSQPGRSPSAVAPALLERHRASLRAYLGTLPGAEPVRVEQIVAKVFDEAAAQAELEDDPAVWLFQAGRRRLLGSGQRGDIIGQGDEVAGDESQVEGEDPRIAVHRAFGRLTAKQQEALRLKFQFGFDLDELARVTDLARGGVGGVLHHAMERLCQSLRPPDATEMMQDPRLTAFAFDELEGGEKQAFVESAGDGKRLLEQTDALRKAGQVLTQVLTSGAPVPKRRRRRGAAWRSPRVVVGALVGLLLIGVGAWWMMSLRAAEAGAPRPGSRTEESDAADGRLPGHRPGDPLANRAGAGAPARPERELRPGEAEWERKAFGRGLAQGGGGAGSSTGSSGGSPSITGGGTSAGAGTGLSAAGFAADAGGQPDARSPETDPDRPAGSGVPISGESNRSAPRSFSGSEPSTVIPSPGVAGGLGGGAGAGSAAAVGAEPGRGRGAQAAGPAKRPLLAPVDLRRRLARGGWPRKDDVLLGDLLASANAGLEPAPAGAPDAPLQVHADLVRSPWKPDRHLMRVAVSGRSAPPPARRPASLVFVIDVSDSMGAPNRLALVQEGIRRLADRLIPEDRVAVITYAASATVRLSSQPLGEKGLELRNTLAGLTTAGRTNGSEGLRLGLEVARTARVEGGLNVVVLCTDGNFNLGDTEPAQLAALARGAAAAGIRLSVFGFGRSDRNDLRLELLAAAGGGRSCYVNTRDEAERLLAGQVDGLFAAAAVDVELKVSFDPKCVAGMRRVDDPAADPLAVTLPEVLPGRSGAAWYELELREQVIGSGALAKLEATYRRPGAEQREHQAGTASVQAEVWGRTDESFRFGAAMTELARILQAGPGAAGPDLDRLESWVQANLPEVGGYRTELLEDIAAAREAAAAR